MSEFFNNHRQHNDNVTTVIPKQRTDAINKRNILIQCSLITLFCIGEITVGVYSGSVLLLVDGFHMFSDIFGLLIGVYAIEMAKKYDYNLPKQNNHTDSFKDAKGYREERSNNLKFNQTTTAKRFTVLGGLINSVSLVVVAFFMCLEAVEKLLAHDHVIESPNMVILVGCLSLFINSIGLFLFNGHGHSHGIQSCPHSSSNTANHHPVNSIDNNGLPYSRHGNGIDLEMQNLLIDNPNYMQLQDGNVDDGGVVTLVPLTPSARVRTPTTQDEEEHNKRGHVNIEYNKTFVDRQCSGVPLAHPTPRVRTPPPLLCFNQTRSLDANVKGKSPARGYDYRNERCGEEEAENNRLLSNTFIADSSLDAVSLLKTRGCSGGDDVDGDGNRGPPRGAAYPQCERHYSDFHPQTAEVVIDETPLHSHSHGGRKDHDYNINAIFLHILADFCGALCIITNGILNKYLTSELKWLIDPVLTLFLAGLICMTILPLLKNMFDIVLLQAPVSYVDKAECIDTNLSILARESGLVLQQWTLHQTTPDQRVMLISVSPVKSPSAMVKIPNGGDGSSNLSFSAWKSFNEYACCIGIDKLYIELA